MSGVNKVILVGRCATPEIKTMQNGSKVANISIITTERYTTKSGEKVETNEWHSCQMWRGLADVCEKYVKKGDMLYIEGKLKTRTWEKNGEKRYITEVVVDNMTMLGSAKGQSQGTQQSEPMQDDESDDLPF